jgi:phosphoheptose isomerase
VQALGSNPAVLTAWANDVSYSEALAKELARHVRIGDALICLSCSGRSPNIRALCTFAQHHAMPLLLITGKNAPSYPDIPALIIPHTHSGIIEDCHLAIGHWLTEALCSR